MQLCGKINGLAAHGFGLVSILLQVGLALILEDCHFRMSKVGLALVCFSALLSILEVLVLCGFDGLGFKEVSGRRKLCLGEQILGNKSKLVLFSKGRHAGAE